MAILRIDPEDESFKEEVSLQFERVESVMEFEDKGSVLAPAGKDDVLNNLYKKSQKKIFYGNKKFLYGFTHPKYLKWSRKKSLTLEECVWLILAVDPLDVSRAKNKVYTPFHTMREGEISKIFEQPAWMEEVFVEGIKKDGFIYWKGFDESLCIDTLSFFSWAYRNKELKTPAKFDEVAIFWEEKKNLAQRGK
jgi:hypothetical protein